LLQLTSPRRCNFSSTFTSNALALAPPALIRHIERVEMSEPDGGFTQAAAASRLAAAAAVAEMEADGVAGFSSFDNHSSAQRRASVSRMGEGGEAHNESILGPSSRERESSSSIHGRRLDFSSISMGGEGLGISNSSSGSGNVGPHAAGEHDPPLTREASLRHDEDLAAAVTAMMSSMGQHCDEVDAFLNATAATSPHPFAQGPDQSMARSFV